MVLDSAVCFTSVVSEMNVRMVFVRKPMLMVYFSSSVALAISSAASLASSFVEYLYHRLNSSVLGQPWKKGGRETVFHVSVLIVFSHASSRFFLDSAYKGHSPRMCWSDSTVLGQWWQKAFGYLAMDFAYLIFCAAVLENPL